MIKQSLVIVHGMGQHTKESFEKEVVSALNVALKLYPSYKDKDINNLVNIVSVEYDDIFNSHREKMADTATDLSVRLKAISTASSIPAQLLTRLLNIEKKIGSDSMFATHWLDVIFYRFTELAELARIRLGKAISKEIANKGAANVHILAHSLGTSVAHDAIASLYDPNYELGTTVKSLSPSIHAMGSLHMIANVSRLLESFIKVKHSVVKSGIDGCTAYFREYRHRLDPFTKPKPFNPAENVPWTFPQYQLTYIRRLTQLNTHDISHYLANPKVHRKLLKFVYRDFSPSKFEKEQADKTFNLTTISGKAKMLETKLKDIKLTDEDSVKDFLKAGVEFKNIVKSLGGEFK